MVLFGTDPLLGHGDPLRGKAALEAVDFYMHVDTIINPSAMFADLILPAATCWEREALMPSSEMAEDTLNWAQLRPAVVKPLHESRSDTEIIFDLAKKLGLSEQFFNSDIDAALNYQLAPSGFSTQQLQGNPVGMRSTRRDPSPEIRRDQSYERRSAASTHRPERSRSTPKLSPTQDMRRCQNSKQET